MAVGGRRALISAVARAEREVAAASVVAPGGERGAVARVNKVLEDALANRVSDIHFEPGRDRLRIRFRQDGVMVPHGDVPERRGAWR